MTGFKPRLWPTLATLIVCPILIGLGVWQLERAQEKRGLARAFHESQQQVPQPLSQQSLHEAAARQWLPVAGQGTYLPVIVLLDNRVRDRRPGYDVFSVLKVNEQINVLVDRGWIPADPNRAVLPTPDTPSQTTQFAGNLGPVPATGITINRASNDIEQVAPKTFRVQHINPTQLENILNRKLAASVLYLDDNAPAGFERGWPTPGFNPEKHEAYASQWFIMALIVFGLFIGLNWQRKDPKVGRD